MSNTQLEMGDSAEEKRDKYKDYLARNIKKFEFYCQQSEYPKVANALKTIRKNEGLKTNTEAIIFLLKRYMRESNANRKPRKEDQCEQDDRNGSAGN